MMKQLLLLDLKFLWKTLTIIGVLYAAAVAIKVLIKHNTVTQFDQGMLTMNFGDTLFLFALVASVFLYMQKINVLDKLKLFPWYDTLPVTQRTHINTDVFIVLVSHIIIFIMTFVYYSIYDDFHKFHGIMLMFGISLLMNALLLRFGRRNKLIQVIAVSLGGTFIILVFAFHFMAINNVVSMNLNVVDNPVRYFYLFQLPYIITAIGILTCLSALKMKKY